LVDADGVDVNAIAVGINIAPGSPFLLTGSRVHALEAVRGELSQQGANDLSLPPLNLLGAIGIPLILLAIVLEGVHTVRQRRAGSVAPRWQPPPRVASNVSTESSVGTAPSALSERGVGPRPAAVGLKPSESAATG
jgi:hypothetical protein